MATLTNTSRICGRCLGDPVLTSRIESSGPMRTCALCERNRATMALGTLAQSVAPVLLRHYEVATEEPSFGSPRILTFADVLGRVFPRAASRRVLDVIGMSLLSNYGDRSGPDSDFWLEDQRYEVAFPFWAEVANERWDRFRRRTLNRRTLSTASRRFLDWLFDDVHNMTVRATRKGARARPVVTRVSRDTPLYRGRIPRSSAARDAIHHDPARQMFTPPAALTPQGRMNRAHSPVFYGAFDRETCVAETRPSISDDVYTAEFRVTRDLVALDLGLLDLAFDQQPSFFRRDYKRERTRREILKKIHEFIRAPVRPDDHHEYGATQSVADYLATVLNPPIDAVIFISSQREKGRNLVIFQPELALEYMAHSLWFHTVKAVEYRAWSFPYIAEKPRRMMFS